MLRRCSKALQAHVHVTGKTEHMKHVFCTVAYQSQIDDGWTAQFPRVREVVAACQTVHLGAAPPTHRCRAARVPAPRGCDLVPSSSVLAFRWQGRAMRGAPQTPLRMLAIIIDVGQSAPPFHAVATHSTAHCVRQASAMGAWSRGGGVHARAYVQAHTQC